MREAEHPDWEKVERQNYMVVYTDGSYRKERAEGTYAWIAGWHDKGTRLKKQQNRERDEAETHDSERTEQSSKEPEKEEDQEHEHRRRKRIAQQERKTTAHWDKITKQWQRARTKRQKTSKDAKEKQGRKRDNTEQTSITRFMTKRQKRDDSKEKSK